MRDQTHRWLQTTTCPECAAPAEVVRRHVLTSTDGPVEHAVVRCVRLHTFNLPVAMLVGSDRTRTSRRPTARSMDGRAHRQ